MISLFELYPLIPIKKSVIKQGHYYEQALAILIMCSDFADHSMQIAEDFADRFELIQQAILIPLIAAERAYMETSLQHVEDERAEYDEFDNCPTIEIIAKQRAITASQSLARELFDKGYISEREYQGYGARVLGVRNAVDESLRHMQYAIPKISEEDLEKIRIANEKALEESRRDPVPAWTEEQWKRLRYYNEQIERKAAAKESAELKANQQYLIELNEKHPTLE